VLDREVIYHLNNATSLFCFGYFEIGSETYTWVGLDHSPPIYTLCSWDDGHEQPHPDFTG
jgi:hypothetical protein